MKKNFYYSKTDDAKELINELDKSINPLYQKLLDRGYEPEQVSHAIHLYLLDLELSKYLEHKINR